MYRIGRPMPYACLSRYFLEIPIMYHRSILNVSNRSPHAVGMPLWIFYRDIYHVSQKYPKCIPIGRPMPQACLSRYFIEISIVYHRSILNVSNRSPHAVGMPLEILLKDIYILFYRFLKINREIPFVLQNIFIG